MLYKIHTDTKETCLTYAIRRAFELSCCFNYQIRCFIKLTKQYFNVHIYVYNVDTDEAVSFCAYPSYRKYNLMRSLIRFFRHLFPFRGYVEITTRRDILFNLDKNYIDFPLYRSYKKNGRIIRNKKN